MLVAQSLHKTGLEMRDSVPYVTTWHRHVINIMSIPSYHSSGLAAIFEYPSRHRRREAGAGSLSENNIQHKRLMDMRL